MTSVDMYLDECITNKQTHCADIAQHLKVLRQLAGECKHVTEFGFRYGASFAALLSGGPKKLVTYDVHIPDVMMDFFLEATKEKDVVLQFNKCSTLEAQPIETTDLLFIDTLHTYDQLRHELTLHGDKALKYLVFHDTYTFGLVGEDQKGPGLLQAVLEFMAEHPWWVVKKSYTHNNGLLVLERSLV